MKRLISIASATLISLFAIAQDCDIRISVAPITQGDNVPHAINKKIEAALMRAATGCGVTADPYYGQFFVAGRFDASLDDVVPGPPAKHVLKSTLTLYIGDAENQQVYATESFDVKGVGNSEERAYISALSSLNSSNVRFSSFIEKAKAKILDYYNANYKSYLSQAKLALSNREYDKALYFASSIPECCVGYSQAYALIQDIYKSNRDYESQMLLAQAYAEWGAHPDEYGAERAYYYLSQIDPSSSCYPRAQELSKTISKVVKENWDFENKEKYKDELNLEKQRINAARDVAVAYAKSRPRTVTNFVVVRPRYY